MLYTKGLLSFRDRKPVHDKPIAREDRKAFLWSSGGENNFQFSSFW